MAAVGKSSDISRFLQSDLDYIFMKNLESPKYEEYKQCCSIKNVDKKTSKFDSIGNLPPAQERDEGDAIVYGAFEQAYQTTVTSKNYTTAFKMTEDEMEDDYYGILKRAASGELGRNINSTREAKVAAIWDAVFDTTGADGVYYASASHPLVNSSLTNDNLASGTITWDNVVSACNKFNSIYDYGGNLMATKPDKILAHANQEATVLALLQSTLRPFESSNTKNTVMNLTPVFNRYVSTAPWHILDSSIDSVIWADRRGMKSNIEQDKINTLNYYYNASIRGRAAQINPGFGHVSSTGA